VVCTGALSTLPAEHLGHPPHTGNRKSAMSTMCNVYHRYLSDLGSGGAVGTSTVLGNSAASGTKRTRLSR
jgi:hypothetical protein